MFKDNIATKDTVTIIIKHSGDEESKKEETKKDEWE